MKGKKGGGGELATKVIYLVVISRGILSRIDPDQNSRDFPYISSKTIFTHPHTMLFQSNSCCQGEGGEGLYCRKLIN